MYYTDAFRGYQSLRRYGKHHTVSHGRTLVDKRTKNHINGIEGFWSYAKHILYNYRGGIQVTFSDVPKRNRIPVQSPAGESLQELRTSLFWFRFTLITKRNINAKLIVTNMKYRNSKLFSKAISVHLAGNMDEAEALCRRILSSDPRHFDALSLLGTICLQRGHLEEGVRLIGLSLEISPKQIAALNNRGKALNALKRHPEALESLDQTIALNPRFTEAYNSRGNALVGLKRHAEALESYDRAIALNPRFAGAHYNRGNVLIALNRYAEALGSFDRAIALNPGFAEAYRDRGNVLIALNRHAEALESYDRAIALNPGFAEAYNSRGNALVGLKRHAEALESFDRAIALNPGFAEAYWNMGFLKLLLGEYEEGWQFFHAGMERDKRREARRNFPKPLWLGKESIADKTILLHAAQGYGDTIQMCRYAPMVEALGAKVVLEVQQPLVELISTLKDSIRVIPQGGTLPEFDYHCPLLSLPLAFKSTVSTIPAKTPYLAADPKKQQQWRNKLGPKAASRIGLVWSGAQRHPNDHNRSISMEMLLPLFDLRLELHCLQKEIRPPDREVLARYRQITTHENDLNDFSDTAALLMEMDFVISVDSSLANLAGALGKSVWILLPFAPDCRWFLEREDSLWYPTARLFRQPQIGDWPSVIEKVAAELKLLF